MILKEYFLHAGDFGDLDLAGQQHFRSLNLREFLAVRQENLHVVVIVVLQKVIKAMLDAELLAFVGEQAHIDY